MWRVDLSLAKLRMAVAIVLFAVALLLQWLSGAFTAEFSGYPDEASHYMSGLLVHDYVISGFAARPMRFAQDFYLHYPYLAIGHWPPLFYVIEGAWMLLFSPSKLSVMILMAVIVTTLAVCLFEILHTEFGALPALTTALLFVCVPLVQDYTSMVMLETLLALLCFWAVQYYGRFLDTGDWRDSLKFGVVASLAILTKGNGFLLGLVPPIAILLTRRFYLLKRPAFWIPALVVIPVALPWHLLTARLILPTFMDILGINFTERALRFYGLVVIKSVGPAIIVLALVGLYSRAVKAFRRRNVEAKWAVAASFLLSVLLFYVTTPAGIEARYMVAAIPFVLMFFLAGAHSLSGFWSLSGLQQPLRFGLFILFGVLIFAGTSFGVPKRASYGFHQAVTRLMSMPEFTDSLALVSSETATGEGIFVSEVAMNGDRDRHAVIRASKVLAEDDWNVTYYKPRYSSPQALMSCLDESPIRFIIIDTTPSRMQYEHHRQLRDIVSQHPEAWELVGAFGGDMKGGHTVYVYRSTKPRTREAGLAVLQSSVLTNMNSTLDHWPVSMMLSCGAPDSPVRADTAANINRSGR